eukprot:2699-Heterococcus_DN1.PRE.3
MIDIKPKLLQPRNTAATDKHVVLGASAAAATAVNDVVDALLLLVTIVCEHLSVANLLSTQHCSNTKQSKQCKMFDLISHRPVVLHCTGQSDGFVVALRLA